jgi:hypothetical protein
VKAEVHRDTREPAAILAGGFMGAAARTAVHEAPRARGAAPDRPGDRRRTRDTRELPRRA